MFPRHCFGAADGLRLMFLAGWLLNLTVASAVADLYTAPRPAADNCAVCSYENLVSNCSFGMKPEWTYLIQLDVVTNFPRCSYSSTWPGTFCADGCCRLPRGVDHLPFGFTIHGLWPNYAGLEYPTCCSCPFTRAGIVSMVMKDENMQKKLRLYWPVLKRCDFLQYEYEKHGSCAASVYDGVTGPMDYFSAAINLRERWDFAKILQDHGIKQSSRDRPFYYDLHREILPAIEKTIGVKVIIGCEAEAGSTRPANLLSEIRVCVARDPTNKLNPPAIDCPDNLISKETTCNASPHGIRLPLFPRLQEHSACMWP